MTNADRIRNMTDEELSIIRDNIAEYGQTNITQEEYNMIYNKAIDDFEDKLLYQIGDLGIRDIIEEIAEQLKESEAE